MDDGLYKILSTLAIAGVCGLVGWVVFLQRDVSAYKLHVADHYTKKRELEKIEESVHEMRQEMKSVLEILYEVRADIRAGNVSER